MSVTNFHTGLSQGNNTAISHNNMVQFGWGAFLGLNARGPLLSLDENFGSLASGENAPHDKHKT